MRSPSGSRGKAVRIRGTFAWMASGCSPGCRDAPSGPGQNPHRLWPDHDMARGSRPKRRMGSGPVLPYRIDIGMVRPEHGIEIRRGQRRAGTFERAGILTAGRGSGEIPVGDDNIAGAAWIDRTP